jgi:hypothetical protein
MPDITLILNDQEQQALMQVLDQATRSAGLQAAATTVHFHNKLEQALAAVQPKEPVLAAKPADADAKPRNQRASRAREIVERFHKVNSS